MNQVGSIKVWLTAWKIQTIKKYIALMVLLTVFFLYIRVSINSFQVYDQIGRTAHDCEYFQRRMYKIVSLTQTVHDILEKNSLSHFLLYGSIWGPLRGFNGPLPWDYDVDFGAFETSQTDEQFEKVTADLDKVGICTTKYFKTGKYDFRFKNYNQLGPDDHPPVVDIFLMKKSWFGLARRTGIEAVVLAYHYYLHHTIPYRLLDKDLPKVKFAGRYIQTPKGGIEVMKYLYRDNWKEIKKPSYFNCSQIKYE